MSSPTQPSPAEPTGPTRTCPVCQAQASGKFCSNCGATLAAANCAACDAPLSPGARFCHRCGTPAGADGGAEPRSFSSALPWGVAAIALVALIALVAGQRFSHAPADSTPPDVTPSAAPFAGATGNGAAPDISNMTPAEAAVRLYNRVMEAHENQHQDTVQMFAPMAITAYSMIGKLDLDQHYDVGRIAAVSGDSVLARAEADTILAAHPNHLLGLILAGNAAHMRHDISAERRYYDELASAAPTERAKALPEYLAHSNDITIALDARRP